MSRNRFAEVMGIQPSGLSHILSGRNNPGYDFIVKLIARFPEINPYWLLGDSDRMLNDPHSETDAASVSESKVSVPDDLDKVRSAQDRTSFSDKSVRKTGSSASRREPESNSPRSDNFDAIVDKMSNIPTVERVVIFFTDRTFEVFTPKKDF